MEKFLMTHLGYSKLNMELTRLINEERPLAIEALKDAKGFGGELSENIQYIEAKYSQEALETKIMEIQNKLSNSKVVKLEEIVNDGIARFGTIVKLVDLETDAILQYQIVGVDEISIKDLRISYKSPMGSAILNKKIGEVIYFRTPSGDRELEILEIILP
jgi:transcription elongation factor GreA